MTSTSRVFPEPSKLHLRVVGTYLVLIVANFAPWIWAFLLFYDRSVVLGTALLT